MRVTRMMCVVMLQVLASNAIASAEPSRAEYAIRWDTSKSLTTLEDVKNILNIKGDVEEYSFSIEYFRISPDKVNARDVALDADVIARARVEENKATQKVKEEITLKYRSDNPIPKGLATWDCPLGKVKDKDKKYELDISFGRDEKIKKRYSLSCSDKGVTFPDKFNAQKPDSKKTMTRLKFESAVIDGKTNVNELKIEEWKSAGGKSIIEISMSGDNDNKKMDLFRSAIVIPIIDKLHIDPILENKSDNPDESRLLVK